MPELSVRGLRPGGDVRLEFDAVPQQSWTGTILRVVPQADLLSRSFPVRIAVENRIVDGTPQLKGGMLARAWLPVGETGSATVVPKDALVLGGPRPVVFVIDPSDGGGTSGNTAAGSVRPVEVAVGAAVGGGVEVRGPLQPGTLVVVRGNERLRPGTSVAYEPASTQKAAAAGTPPQVVP